MIESFEIVKPKNKCKFLRISKKGIFYFSSVFFRAENLDRFNACRIFYSNTKNQIYLKFEENCINDECWPVYHQKNNGVLYAVRIPSQSFFSLVGLDYLNYAGNYVPSKISGNEFLIDLKEKVIKNG